MVRVFVNVIPSRKLIRRCVVTPQSHDASVHSVDQLFISQWLSVRSDKASLQRSGIHTLTTELWSHLRKSTKNPRRLNPAQILQLTHALVSCLDLRAASVDDHEKTLFITVMVYFLMLGALVLNGTLPATLELRTELRHHMCQLAVSPSGVPN